MQHKQDLSRAKKNDFYSFLVPDFKMTKTSEYFDESVIYHLNGLLISIHVPKHRFQAYAIKSVVKHLLRFPVLDGQAAMMLRSLFKLPGLA